MYPPNDYASDLLAEKTPPGSGMTQRDGFQNSNETLESHRNEPDLLRSRSARPLTTPPNWTIYLIERTYLVREGLAELLSHHCPEYEIRMAESDPSAAACESDAALIVMSIRSGCSAQRATVDALGNSAWLYRVPVLLISDADDPSQARLALRAGFAGFFPTIYSAEMLIAAVRLVLAGGRFVPPSLIQLSLQDPATRAGAPTLQREGTNGKGGRGVSAECDGGEASSFPHDRFS
jgi:DNA-binding NarL/FixJ family response regulator